MVGVRCLWVSVSVPVLSWNWILHGMIWELALLCDSGGRVDTMEAEEWAHDAVEQGSKREKPANTGMVRIHRKARRDGCPGNRGGISPFPLYLMANECQRLSCLHPVKLGGWWQVQVWGLLWGGGYLAEKDKPEPGWQTRSFSHEDSKNEICFHVLIKVTERSKRYQNVQ